MTGVSSASVGRYETLRRLAVGGMGEIYLARERGRHGFSRLVVIKRMLPELARKPMYHDMFVDEARIVGQLGHPNICQILELGEEDGVPFLALEYVRGDSLAGIWDRASIDGVQVPTRLTLRMLADTAWALHHAHEANDADGRPLNLIHRDISPHNVMVSYHGDIKLMDFGIARADNRIHRTQTGKVKGKVSYMAPEQLRGLPLDRRADVFAVGVMLWELTLNRRLFGGGNEIETLQKAAQGHVPTPCSIDPSYPPRLEAIVMHALENNADRRTATAGELAHGLIEVLNSMGGAERRDVATLMERLFPEEAHLPEDAVPTRLWLDRDDVELFQSAPTRDASRNPGLDHRTIRDSRPIVHSLETAIGARRPAAAPASDRSAVTAASRPASIATGVTAAGLLENKPTTRMRTSTPFEEETRTPHAEANPLARISTPHGMAQAQMPGRRRWLVIGAAAFALVVAAIAIPLALRVDTTTAANNTAASDAGSSTTVVQAPSDASTLVAESKGNAASPTAAPPTAAPPTAVPADAAVVAGEPAHKKRPVTTPKVASAPTSATVDVGVSQPAGGSHPDAKPVATGGTSTGVDTGVVDVGVRVPPAAPEPGTLAVSSNVTGVVVIDGTRRKSTPFQTSLAAGTYEVALELEEGAGTLHAKAEVIAGRKTKCKVDHGSLHCSASP